MLYTIVSLASKGSAVNVIADATTRKNAHGSILNEIGYIWQFYLPATARNEGLFPRLPHHAHILVRRAGGTLRVAGYDVPQLGLQRRAHSRRAPRRAPCTRTLGLTAALRNRLAEVLSHILRWASGRCSSSAPTIICITTPASTPSPVTCCRCSRCGGRRWRWPRAVPDGAGGRSRESLIVSLVLAHNLFSQLLVISRYYG